MGLAAKRERIEALRARIAEAFGDAEPRTARRAGPSIASGWAALDAVLATGGLAPGDTLAIEADAGAGALALVSSWAREASRRGEAALVVDAPARSLPHPWVEPPDGAAPIWIVAPAAPAESWAAADIALRSGAFGLVAVLDAPPARPGAGPRLVRLARDRATRLIVAGAAPFAPTTRVVLRSTEVRWREAPVGGAPAARAIEARCGPGTSPELVRVEVMRDDTVTDRLRPSARAADRRAPPPPGRATERKSRR